MTRIATLTESVYHIGKLRGVDFWGLRSSMCALTNKAIERGRTSNHIVHISPSRTKKEGAVR